MALTLERLQMQSLSKNKYIWANLTLDLLGFTSEEHGKGSSNDAQPIMRGWSQLEKWCNAMHGQILFRVKNMKLEPGAVRPPPLP